jgi:hypothetical protein
LTGPEFELQLAAGFIVVLSLTAILNKAGDFLYRKGIAKPFYVLGHRLHHRNVLLVLVPASYVVMATLVSLHYVRVLWSTLWPSAEVTFVLAGICLAIDLTLDALSNKEMRGAILHHEWVYFVVPAYVFTHILVLI